MADGVGHEDDGAGIEPREAFEIVDALDDEIVPGRRGVPRTQLARRLAAEAGTTTPAADRAIDDLLARYWAREIGDSRIWPQRVWTLRDGDGDDGDSDG